MSKIIKARNEAIWRIALILHSSMPAQADACYLYVKKNAKKKKALLYAILGIIRLRLLKMEKIKVDK